MRYINFRGKTMDGHWVYGNLLLDPPRGAYILYRDYAPSFPLNSDAYFPVKVRKKTVHQASGVRDRNGNDIYEGDIVACYFRGGFLYNCIVEYRAGAFLCVPIGKNTPFCFLGDKAYDVEVVGNVVDDKKC